MMDKRGQGLSVETVILIVIGVLVLIFLIIGFTMGWGKIFPFINPPNNVKDIVDKCGYACQTDDKYNYCSSQKEVTTESAIVVKDAKGGDVAFGKKITASCYELSAIAALGMPACLNVACGDDKNPYVFKSEDFAKAACVKFQRAGDLKYRNPAGNEATYPCAAVA